MVLGLVFHFLRQPLILSYIITGVILGPGLGFGIIKEHHDIQLISELGLIVMMFILGLGIQLQHLVSAGRVVLIGSCLQILGCLLCGVLFFYYAQAGFANQVYEIFYLGAALTISSTALVIKILTDRREMGRLSSRITLGFLICQDFFVIVLMGFQPSFSDPQLLAIAIALVKISTMMGLAFLGTKYILVRIYHLIAKHMELMVVVSLGWCFALVGAFAYLGLSREMGALVAGLSMASFPYNQDVITKLSSLREFFISLFFVSLGLQFPHLSLEIVIPAIVMVGLIVLTRFITVFPVLTSLRLGARTSFITTLNLSQLSEFVLVFTTLGVSYAHIEQHTLDILILTMVLTSMMSPYLIQNSFELFKWVSVLGSKMGWVSRMSKLETEMEGAEPSHSPTLVILGIYQEGSSLIEDLLKKYSENFKSQLLIIDFNPSVNRALKQRGIPCVYGDFSHIDTLQRVNLASTEIIISPVPDFILRGTTNKQLLLMLKRLATSAKIIVTADTLYLAKELYQLGADYVILPRTIVSTHVSDVLESIRSGEAVNIKERALQFLGQRKEVLD